MSVCMLFAFLLGAEIRAVDVCGLVYKNPRRIRGWGRIFWKCLL